MINLFSTQIVVLFFKCLFIIISIFFRLTLVSIWALKSVLLSNCISLLLFLELQKYKLPLPSLLLPAPPAPPLKSDEQQKPVPGG